MTALTKLDREETIRNIMRESCAPRFAVLNEKITEHANATLRAEHPKFYELLRDEEARLYLAVGQRPNVRVELSSGFAGARQPSFTVEPEFNKLHREHWFSVNSCRDILPTVSHPERAGTVTIEHDHPLNAEYCALWGSFEDAWGTVESMVHGYKVRERFEADFPEFAKHLPAAKAKTMALTVPVADIRAKLSAAGIPPTLQGA